MLMTLLILAIIGFAAAPLCNGVYMTTLPAGLTVMMISTIVVGTGYLGMHLPNPGSGLAALFGSFIVSLIFWHIGFRRGEKRALTKPKTQ